MEAHPSRPHHLDKAGLFWEMSVLPDTASRKVLIVDDDPGVRQALRVILEIDDFDVVGEADNGVEAIPRALALEPDVVVLDQEMPRRSGAQTARMLRQLLPDVQIVAFSAILEAKPSWADAWLNKSSIVDLSDVVGQLIDLRSA
jgi:chemotaxis response regulator CheB